ncbi:hypothetical protein LSH36_25g04031 [Paralvinella palmiformis]|uniref:Autophagy-related protein 11 C-terminal domain-containing protein n=1 Tax=Paralvinella palmiformis TaxID=53620 RepID=A0AAD9KC13_9ANNE|nr:hypothetical protein LSH36_25g04031 [Paralvinella palmiformis]
MLDSANMTDTASVIRDVLSCCLKMNLSMSVSCRGLVQDKVSITSCNVGELVLLCLDDQRANYVVFTVTNLLHFLHSDYLEVLGLKTGPGEPKKSWVLAEVTDKEYCQAKKPQNRYNVPVGTKFYRIKARPWSRDMLPQPLPSQRQHPDVPPSATQPTSSHHPHPPQQQQPQQQQQPGACDLSKADSKS